jgi:hypothetical protein
MTQSTTLDDAFDTANEAGTPPIKLLPKGRYTAEITKATIGPTKAGNAQMITLQWVITEGDYEDRVVFQTIIYQHVDSSDAQRFGRQKFKDVCFACGITDPVTDLDVLLHKPCSIYVGVEHDKSGEYADKNKVTKVLPLVTAAKGNGKEVVPFNDEVGF